ncbi:hypothetical protein Tco_0089873 [Tanacetum coccineum]
MINPISRIDRMDMRQRDEDGTWNLSNCYMKHIVNMSYDEEVKPNDRKPHPLDQESHGPMKRGLSLPLIPKRSDSHV